MKQVNKDLTNWKKDIAVAAYMQSLYIYNELIRQGNWMSLRWRTGWVQRNFFNDENLSVIVRKERDRRKDKYEERLRLNEAAESEREARWAREADEKWLFADKPTIEDRKKWGLPLFDGERSSDSSSESEEEEDESQEEEEEESQEEEEEESQEEEL